MCFLLPFSAFHCGSVTKDRLTREKETKHILVRNAGMTNSRRKTEFGLTDYLNQRTIYF